MNKLILFFYIMSNIVSAQSGFSTVIERPEEYIEGLYMPAIELTKNKIVAVTASNYRNFIGLTAFYYELNSRGEVMISRSYLDSLNRILCLQAIYEDSAVWMCGAKFLSKDTVHYAYLAKLDLNFDTIWTREYPSIYNRNLPVFVYMIRTKTGNLCAVGVDNHNDPATDRNRNNSWMLLVDSMGNFINSHHLPKDFSNGIEGYQSVVEDQYGFLYACGFFISNKNISFIVKYDQRGNFIWRKNYEDVIYGEGLFDTKLLKNGNLIFTGTRANNPLGGDWRQYTQIIDTSGKILDKNISFNGYICETKHCVQDEAENLICAGQIKETFSSQGTKAWLIKFSSSGDSLWERRYESNWAGTSARFENISKSSDGGFYLTGLNWIPENRSGRAWVAKTDSNGCIVPGCTTDFITEKEPHKDLFLLSPNPAKDYVNVYMNDVEFYDREYVLYLYDQQGSIVQHQVVQGRVTQVDLNSLPAGMYYYRIVDGKNKFMQSGKVVVNR